MQKSKLGFESSKFLAFFYVRLKKTELGYLHLPKLEAILQNIDRSYFVGDNSEAYKDTEISGEEAEEDKEYERYEIRIVSLLCTSNCRNGDITEKVVDLELLKTGSSTFPTVVANLVQGMAYVELRLA